MNLLTTTAPTVTPVSAMDVITLVIAIAGFSLSLLSWVYTFVTQRKRLDMRIFSCSAKDDRLLLYMMIENRSRLPIAITRISLIQGDSLTDCVPIPMIVAEATRKVGQQFTERKYDYSTAIPIKLDSLGATDCIVFFQGLPAKVAIDATALTFQICTNRGRKVKRTLLLPSAQAKTVF